MMFARLVHTADIQRLLASRAVQRSAHFAVHYVSASPTQPGRRTAGPADHNLSTAASEGCSEVVDKISTGLPHAELPAAAAAADTAAPPAGHWLGCIVPKRHAKRAVTRNLVKRQMRAAADRAQPQLRPGLWMLRLSRAFAREGFVSAASEPLRRALRSELDELMARLAASARQAPPGDVPRAPRQRQVTGPAAR